MTAPRGRHWLARHPLGGCPRDCWKSITAKSSARPFCLDTPGSPRAAFDHKHLGVYLVTGKAGEVEIGAPVKAPRSDAINRLMRPNVLAAVNGHRRFICRGCYFIYEEARGPLQQEIPAGTDFGRVPNMWQCPDCGTEKGSFRPQVETEVRARSTDWGADRPRRRART